MRVVDRDPVRARLMRERAYTCGACGSVGRGPEVMPDSRPRRETIYYPVDHVLPNGHTIESWLVVDHIIPKKLGGSSDFCNLQALCDRCNVKKSKNLSKPIWMSKDDFARLIRSEAEKIRHNAAVLDAFASRIEAAE